jgi:hypothetical protein
MNIERAERRGSWDVTTFVRNMDRSILRSITEQSLVGLHLKLSQEREVGVVEVPPIVVSVSHRGKHHIVSASQEARM